MQHLEAQQFYVTGVFTFVFLVDTNGFCQLLYKMFVWLQTRSGAGWLCQQQQTPRGWCHPPSLAWLLQPFARPPRPPWEPPWFSAPACQCRSQPLRAPCSALLTLTVSSTPPMRATQTMPLSPAPPSSPTTQPITRVGSMFGDTNIPFRPTSKLG